MSSSKNKKDKGKAIQEAEDYQLQVPVQNQFAPLSQNQFPPLPYKTAVTNPSSSHSADAYLIRYNEHLLLTSCKPPPLTNIISNIVQKSFGNHHFATDDLRKFQKFYELILVDTHSVSLTYTFDKYHPNQILYSKCIIKSVINAQPWKDPLSIDFLLPLLHKLSIIMTTKMPGIEHFCYNQMFIPGFLIFMNNVKILFLYGSSIGGQCLAVRQSFFPLKQKKVGTIGLKLP